MLSRSAVTMLTGSASVIFLLILHVHSSNAGCPRPTPDELGYGYLSWSIKNMEDFEELTINRVWCKMGSYSNIRCQNGRWHRVQASTFGGRERCDIEPRCADPPRYNHTLREISGRRIGDRVTYKCLDNNFEPVNTDLPDSMSKTCRQKKKKKCLESIHGDNPCKIGWNNLKRTYHCKGRPGKRFCELPGDPPMNISYFEFAREREDEDDYLRERTFEPGDYLEIECSTGHSTLEIECLEDGRWDSDLCQEIKCTKPNLPEHVSLSVEKETYSNSESVEVRCDHENHIFRGIRVPILTMHCSNNREWTIEGGQSSVPRCELISCPYIEGLEDGRFNQPPKAHPGDSATAVCYNGLLRGPSTRWCTSHGTWNGTLQVCARETETGCGSPGTPIGGRKIGNHYEIDDEVTFECNHDRVLLGSAKRICQLSKVWSGFQTVCRGKGEYPSLDEVGKAFREAMDVTAQSTSSSQEFQENLRKYKGKNVVMDEVDMEKYNPDSRTPLGQLSKDGLNLYFLFDASASLSQESFKIATNFAKSVMAKLGVGGRMKSGTNVSMASFNTEIRRKHLAVQEDTLESLQAFVDDMAKENTTGSTSLEAALNYLKDVLIPEHVRLSNGRASPHAVMLYTDGVYNTGAPPEGIAKWLNIRYENQLEYFCIGVGNIDLPVLKTIATTEEPGHLIYLKDYSNLAALELLFTANQSFSRCGEFMAYRDVFSTNVTGSRKFWPWMVGLFYTTTEPRATIPNQIADSEVNCGASIIHTTDTSESSWLLTAAHCVHGRDPEKVIARFGSHLSDKYEYGNAVHIRAANFIKHKSYVQQSLENDIALIKLEEAVEFAYNIRPVCLPDQDQTDIYATRTQGEVTGWGGRKKDEDTTDELKTIEVKITDIHKCKTNLSDVESEVNGDWNFCAGNVKHRGEKGEGVQDACKGDSGGPLVVHKTNEHGDYKFTQAGIVSFGPKKCGTRGKPGVYTNVAKFADWIKRNAV